MREILFRGKNIDLEWVEGDLLQNGVDYKTAIRDTKERLVQRVICHTVGQYTGVTDKNGKKIFEGDILYYAKDGINCVVVYDDNTTRYYIIWNENGYEHSVFLGNDKQGEIIGNIHDNPELLK